MIEPAAKMVFSEKTNTTSPPLPMVSELGAGGTFYVGEEIGMVIKRDKRDDYPGDFRDVVNLRTGQWSQLLSNTYVTPVACSVAWGRSTYDPSRP
jgi:hypothetical protein